MKRSHGHSRPPSGKPKIPEKGLSPKIGPDPVCIIYYIVLQGVPGFRPCQRPRQGPQRLARPCFRLTQLGEAPFSTLDRVRRPCLVPLVTTNTRTATALSRLPFLAKSDRCKYGYTTQYIPIFGFPFHTLSSQSLSSGTTSFLL